ncbi:UNVERIFIED_CONTAM: hypothetical protein RMT77_000418 [Armadillidium vulgare]
MVSVEKRSTGIAVPTIELALFSLAFLTFAVYVISIVQNVFSGEKRKRRETLESSERELTIRKKITDIWAFLSKSLTEHDFK